MRQKHFKDLPKKVIYFGEHTARKHRWRKAPRLWQGGGWICGNPRYSEERAKTKREAKTDAISPE